MKVVVFIISIFMLSACGGGSSSGSSGSSGTRFSESELNNSILLAKSISEFDGVTEESPASIVLFNESTMREILLSKERDGNFLDGNAEYSDQPWVVLSSGTLEVTYPNGVVCKTDKESQTDVQIEVVGECTNIDSSLKETLISPKPLVASDLEGLNITNYYEGVNDLYSFGSQGTFDYNVSYSTEELFPQGVGTFTNSKYKNAVRINYPEPSDGSYANFDYGLLILLNGNLNNGLLLEIRYVGNEVLEDVRLMSVNGNDWFGGDYYINWSTRG